MRRHTAQYTDPAHAHAPKVVNGETYEYDPNGNLLSSGGRTLTWDPENRLLRHWRRQTDWRENCSAILSKAGPLLRS